MVYLELHGCRHVAARAVAGVCSAHLLKHRHRHWCRRRHTECTCTQSAQTQVHMHNALGTVASNRGGTACRRACLVHSCVCAPRSASKPHSQPTRRRAQALFIGRRRSCDCAARRGEANTHGSGYQFFRGVRAVCGRSTCVTTASGRGWGSKKSTCRLWTPRNPRALGQQLCNCVAKVLDHLFSPALHSNEPGEAGACFSLR